MRLSNVVAFFLVLVLLVASAVASQAGPIKRIKERRAAKAAVQCEECVTQEVVTAIPQRMPPDVAPTWTAQPSVVATRTMTWSPKSLLTQTAGGNCPGGVCPK